jgi:hypothetical protein
MVSFKEMVSLGKAYVITPVETLVSLQSVFSPLLLLIDVFLLAALSKHVWEVGIHPYIYDEDPVQKV